MKDRAIIKALDARRQEMDADYSHWKSHFQELRDNISPAQGRFSLSERRSDSSLNKRIIDSTAARGLRTLKSGLMAGMTSPSRPWFKLAAGGAEEREDPDVAAWAFQVQSVMYEVLRASNAYRMLNTCYGDIGLFGTFAGMVTSSFDSVIQCHSFPMGSYRLASGAGDRADYLQRDLRMSVAQMADTFGLDECSRRVKDAYDRGNLHDKIDVCHAVEPRGVRDTSSPMSTDKAWASYYWEKGEDNLLQESGFDVSPLLTPRWETIEYEAWSISSPGMYALGDAIQLQGQQRDKAIAVQKMVNPPLQAGAGAAIRYRNLPGGITATSTNDLSKGGLRSIYDVRVDINALREDIYETQQRVNSAFFADLFLMTSSSDRRQVTAREIAERHEEKLLALGPVLESLDHSLLQPLIEATFYHMQAAGMIPPAPDAIAGRPVQVEYISSLAQAQKSVGVAPIERTIGFAATLEQIKPGAMDAVDVDATLREFAEQIGSPPDLLFSEKEVAQARQARQQQQEQQQLMENVEPMANAAKLISEASARGDAGIQQGAAI